MIFGADLFYRAKHDFVVDTDSMIGGVPRPAARRAFFPGPDVSHGGYFDNRDSRAALNSWMTATGPDGVPGFETPTPLPPRSRSAAQRVAGAAGTLIAGRVVLVPDVFGSILVAGGDTVWPNVSRLVAAGVDEVLDITARASATGLVGAYDPLWEALAERYAVIEAPYDSRESLTAAGAALAETLDEALAAESVPVHLVTHGAGALVMLAARTCRPQLWARLRERGGRAVLLSPRFRAPG
jgi:hypothetical protein